MKFTSNFMTFKWNLVFCDSFYWALLLYPQRDPLEAGPKTNNILNMNEFSIFALSVIGYRAYQDLQHYIWWYNSLRVYSRTLEPFSSHFKYYNSEKTSLLLVNLSTKNYRLTNKTDYLVFANVTKGIFQQNSSKIANFEGFL